MAPPRATWKGYLKIAEVVCPIALYAAASSNDRIVLNTVNRATGNRVQRQFVDSVSGKPVEKEDQVKGYEVAKDDYVILEPEEIAAAVPENDKTLAVSAFIGEDEIDDVYFDRPYFLGPSDRGAVEAFALIREGLSRQKVVAIAQAVLFRRVRSVLIRPCDNGLAATTLNFDYEVRSAADAFSNVPKLRIKGEMLQLAEHIIKTKSGEFDPKSFHDRYDAALAELVKAKIEGREIERPKPQKAVTAAGLLEALRESAGLDEKAASRHGKAASREAKPAARRKAS
jgi:DNA end-binding protein Ku